MEFKSDLELCENSWAFQSGLQGQLKGTILAAGMGRRMEPLTTGYLPKPLFPLGGKVPMAELWVRKFVKSGIRNMSMNLCVLSEAIQKHFCDGAKFYANLSYIKEDVPTGTLGGVCKQALGRSSKIVVPGESVPNVDEFEGSTIIAPSGDVVTNFGAELLEEMYEMHRKIGAAFSMVLVPIGREKRKDFGTVIIENSDNCKGEFCEFGRVTEFREKDPDSPSILGNASIYMIEMDLLKTLDQYRTMADFSVREPFYDFGKHVFPAMLGRMPYISLPKDYELLGMKYEGLWFDVGQKRDYLKINKFLLDGELAIELPLEKLPWGYLGNNTLVDFSKVTIIPPIVIGNNCEIENGATIGPYAIIGDHWKIESGTRIMQSVLWERYPYYKNDGTVLSSEDRKVVDNHEIKSNVTVDNCIIVGGTIERSISEKIVYVDVDGKLIILPIDYIPEGPRL